MMPPIESPSAPPSWPQAVLRVVLTSDPMRDAIFGDLHEEFVTDTARLGPSRARAWYLRRTADVLVYAVLDALHCRGWASSTPPMEVPHAVVATPHGPPARRSRTRGGDAGLALLALGVLSLGIVANTVLFTTVRAASDAGARTSPLVSSAIGIAATALTLACAGAAAVLLCAGPRWLRRRLRERH